MTNDLITRAKKLIQKYDGKLRDFTTVGDDEHRCVRIDDFNEPATEIEYEYIRNCGQFLPLIKDLQEKLEDYEDRITELTNAVDYFNPVVDDWTPESIEIENREKTKGFLNTTRPAEVVKAGNTHAKKTGMMMVLGLER